MSELIEKLREILNCERAMGFYYGAISVLALWIFSMLCRFWAWLRYNRKLINIADDKNGAFQLSYATVIQHVTIMLKRSFPQLAVKKIRIRHFGSYKMHITAQISDQADIQALRDAVRPAVKTLLDDTIGIPGVFSKVNVTISALRVSHDIPMHPAPPTTTPEKTENSVGDLAMPVN